MQSKIHIGIVGIGRWGKNLLREFSKISTVVGCAGTGNPDNIAGLRNDYSDLPYFDNYINLLKLPNLNAVAIAVPTSSHFLIAKDAILAGKHIFVEKPFTANSQEAKTLIDLAKKMKVKIFVGYILLYHPIASQLKNILTKNPPDNIQFVLQKWGTFQGDAVWELASHDIALVLNWIGEPKKISLVDQGGFLTKRDWAKILLEFGQNQHGFIIVNRIAHDKQRYIAAISGQNMWIWKENNLYQFSGNPQPELIPVFQTTEEPLTLECRAFIDNITNNTEPITNGEFGLKVIETLKRL